LEEKGKRKRRKRDMTKEKGDGEKGKGRRKKRPRKKVDRKNEYSTKGQERGNEGGGGIGRKVEERGAERHL
jgi:hypothetical protein